MIKFLHRLLCLAFVGAIALPMQAQDTKPETRDIVNQFLTELLEFSKDAGAFAKEQVPLVLQEYIAWGIASSIVWMLPFLFAAYFLPRVWRWAIECADGSEGLSIFAAIAMSAVVVSTVIYHVLEITKAVVAPRVYLIETLSDLLK